VIDMERFRDARHKIGSKVTHYRKFAVDIIWQGSADTIRLIVALGTFIILGRELGPSDYGAYLGTFGVLSPITALGTGGMGLAILQLALREERDLRLVSSMLITTTILATPVTVLGATLVAASVIERMPLLAIVLFAYTELCGHIVLSLTGYTTHAALGVGKASRLRIGSSLLRVTALLLLFATDSVSLVTVAASGAIITTFYGAAVVLFWLPRIGARFTFRLPTREALVTSTQLGTATVAVSLQNDTDKTLLNAYGFERDAGLYGAAFRVISLSMIPLRSINGALFHRFLRSEGTGRGEDVRRSIRYLSGALPLSIVLAAAVWICAPILNVLVGNDFDESIEMIRWLVLYMPLRAVSLSALNGLLGLGAVMARFYTLVLSAALSLIGYFLVIPHYSWRGAVGATLCSEVFLAGTAWLFLRRRQRQADAERDAADLATS